jgi:hypothetical protein
MNGRECLGTGRASAGVVERGEAMGNALRSNRRGARDVDTSNGRRAPPSGIRAVATTDACNGVNHAHAETERDGHLFCGACLGATERELDELYRDTGGEH